MQFTKCIENEELSLFFLEPLLAARLSEVSTLLEQKENELQKSPAGSLRISKSRKTIQYYQITKPATPAANTFRRKTTSLQRLLPKKTMT